MAQVTGTLTDFGLDPLTINSPVLIFRASAPGVAGINLLSARKAVEVIPDANGNFEADLVSTSLVAPADLYYIIEIRYRDTKSRQQLSEVLPWKLLVPPAGGALADLVRVPANPALVWTGEAPPEAPSPGTWWLDPVTGDLTEYDPGAPGWVFKANLRGPAGYNATGAAEDDLAIAAMIIAGSGPTAVQAALAARYAAYSTAAASNTAALASTAAPRWNGA